MTGMRSGDVTPTSPYLVARWLLLSLWSSIQCSPRCSWSSIRCNLLFRCVCWDSMKCEFMIRLFMGNIWVFSQLFYAWILYLCISLWSIDLVWPTRLVYLAMGEMPYDGFNLAVLNPNDRKGHDTYVSLLLREKRWGLFMREFTLSTSCHLA